MFGRNPVLWFIPMMGKSGKPDGNGITWPTKNELMPGNEEGPGTDEIVISII